MAKAKRKYVKQPVTLFGSFVKGFNKLVRRAKKLVAR